MRRFTVLLTAIVALTVAAMVAPLAPALRAAPADSWPSKPVRVIVPFAAGGAADILARTVTDHLSRMFPQPFVIENRAGAGGLVGEQAGARAEADGYTFVVS